MRKLSHSGDWDKVVTIETMLRSVFVEVKTPARPLEDPSDSKSVGSYSIRQFMVSTGIGIDHDAGDALTTLDPSVDGKLTITLQQVEPAELTEGVPLEPKRFGTKYQFVFTADNFAVKRNELREARLALHVQGDYIITAEYHEPINVITMDNIPLYSGFATTPTVSFKSAACMKEMQNYDIIGHILETPVLSNAFATVFGAGESSAASTAFTWLSQYA